VTEPVPAGTSFPFKAAGQLLAAMVIAVLPLVTSAAPATPTEWINTVLVALGAGTVYIAQNQPDGGVWHYTKTIMSALTAAGVVAVSALTDGITATEWYQIAAAAVAVVAVYLVPNDATAPLLGGGRHRAEGT
jgi:hypothetical protein